MFRPVSHVMFDMDGVILDTEPLYSACAVEVARRHGSQEPLTWDIKVWLHIN